jgi:hypothetical protein
MPNFELFLAILALPQDWCTYYFFCAVGGSRPFSRR